MAEKSMGSSSREMDALAGESVVRRRPKNSSRKSGGERKRWSVADVQQTDRQSICFSGGFLSLSPAGRKPATTTTPSVRQPNNWRHSYACDGDTGGQQTFVNNSIRNKLDSIREEENDVAARSATLRADSFTALSLSL